MKQNVIHTLTGMAVLAVPRANTLTQHQKALEMLREKNVREIKTTAYTDMTTNEHVPKLLPQPHGSSQRDGHPLRNLPLGPSTQGSR